MKFGQWMRFLPLWEGENEGAGGGSQGEGSGGNDGEGGSQGDQGQGGGSQSILDFANKGGAADEGAQNKGDGFKLPEGLQLPDHLVGLSLEDTLSKVSKAYAGARRELSQGKPGSSQLEGEVPKEFDQYSPTFEAEGDDDVVASEINSEVSKPIVDIFRKAAFDLQIPDKTFQKFLRAGLGEMAKQGMPIGVTQEQAIQISAEKELGSLTQQVGRAEAGTIINTLENYGAKMVERGAFSAADLAEFRVMVGTADSARVFYRILTGELGEKPIPLGDGGDGQMTAVDAQAKYAAAKAMPHGPERDAALASAQKAMEQAYGNNSSGSVRSSVL